MTGTWRTMLAAEALGSLLLFATVIGSGIMAERLAGGSVGLALLANTIATGAMLFVLITLFGPVSGAHFNPAVTLIMAMRGAIPARLALAYPPAQLCGGLAGMAIAHAMYTLPIVQVSHHARSGAGLWLSEGVATFGLVLTILGTARHRPAAIAANVALYITAAYWFTASTSFANPAITIARSCTDTFAGIAPASVAGFVAAQLTGALAAHVAATRLFDASTE